METTNQQSPPYIPKSLVYRCLQIVQRGLKIYEGENSTHYKGYKQLRFNSRQLFTSYQQFRDVPTINSVVLAASPLFSGDYMTWVSLFLTEIPGLQAFKAEF